MPVSVSIRIHYRHLFLCDDQTLFFPNQFQIISSILFQHTFLKIIILLTKPKIKPKFLHQFGWFEAIFLVRQFFHTPKLIREKEKKISSVSNKTNATHPIMHLGAWYLIIYHH